MAKFLIIRFSSIGDIVLTTPVIRCLKKQVPEAEVHFLTKDSFRSIVEHNPYIDKLHVWAHSRELMVHELNEENYDYIIDLHHNVKTLKLKIKTKLKIIIFSFKIFKKIGLFAFGILTKRKLNDSKIWQVCIIAPLIALFLDMLSNPAWYEAKLHISLGLHNISKSIFNGYIIGNELILINGILTFAGLWIISKPGENKVLVQA